MSYMVFVNFELERARERDYDNAFSDLYTLGLKRLVTAQNGEKVVIPNTGAMGVVEGKSAAAIQDDICARVEKMFKARGLTSRIFVVVGNDWAWGSTSTYAPRLMLVPS